MKQSTSIPILLLLLVASIGTASAQLTESIQENIIANIVAAIIIGVVLIIGKPYIPMVMANPILLILALIGIFMILSYLR